MSSLHADLLDQAVLAATRARLLAAMPLDDPERETTADRVQLVVLRAKGFHPSTNDGHGTPREERAVTVRQETS